MSGKIRSAYSVPRINLITEECPGTHALVRTQMVNEAPAICFDDVYFTGNATKAESSTRDSGNGSESRLICERSPNR